MLHIPNSVGVLCFALLGVSVVGNRSEPDTCSRPNNQFNGYRAVEAFEIRPGILMIPRHSVDGQVCEIGLEKLHYSPEKIRLDSDLSRQEISQIFDELVPNAERGPKPTSLLEQGMTTVSGRGMIDDEEYQNVSIRIFGSYSPDGKGGGTLDEVAATLTWKNRKCK
jgi:hypothetical protein